MYLKENREAKWLDKLLVILFHAVWTSLFFFAFSPFYTVQWSEVLTNWLTVVVALFITISLM